MEGCCPAPTNVASSSVAIVSESRATDRMKTFLKLLEGIALGFQQGEDPVRANQMRCAHHHKRGFRTSNERLDFWQPRPIAIDQETLIHLRFASQIPEDQLFDLDGVARSPGVSHPREAGFRRLELLERFGQHPV